MSAQREPVTAPDAPRAVGPYVQPCRRAGCCSARPSGARPSNGGAGRKDAGGASGALPGESRRVCQAAGTTLGEAVKLTVYVTDIGSFAEVNEVYASFFESSPPARVAIGVAALPLGAKVEIDAVVAFPG